MRLWTEWDALQPTTWFTTSLDRTRFFFQGVQPTAGPDSFSCCRVLPDPPRTREIIKFQSCVDVLNSIVVFTDLHPVNLRHVVVAQLADQRAHVQSRSRCFPRALDVLCSFPKWCCARIRRFFVTGARARSMCLHRTGEWR